MKILIVVCALLGIGQNVYAAGEVCGLELLNVPVGATIRFCGFWKSNDTDEALEDEGYRFRVIEGSNGVELGIWRQPFTTYCSSFAAVGTRVAIEGFKDPASTGHNEGLETEGCEITATINSLPPWVKDYARAAFPWLTISSVGTFGVAKIAGQYKLPVELVATGLGIFAAIANKFASDPIDCSSAQVVFPVFQTPPAAEGQDVITILSNRIVRNATRSIAIARAAVINTNRANCSEFSDDQRLALFNRAQIQAWRVGNHAARLKTQLTNWTANVIAAGITVDEAHDHQIFFEDIWFYMTEPTLRADPFISTETALLRQVLSADELTTLENGMLGTALYDVSNPASWVRLWPDLWPDGVSTTYPTLAQWATSLQAKEVGQ